MSEPVVPPLRLVPKEGHPDVPLPAGVWLPPSVAEHPLLQTDEALGTWVRLLLGAAPRPFRFFFVTHEIALDRGQLLVSIHDWGRGRRGQTHGKLRRILKMFERYGMIGLHAAPGRCGTIITVHNYDAHTAAALLEDAP